MTLIEERHPALARLLALWRSKKQGKSPPPAHALCRTALADLAPITITLAIEHGALFIAESGTEVDALYGEKLGGRGVACLTPGRDDAEREARMAIATGRPFLAEDRLSEFGRRRIARLYLPLVGDGGAPDGVKCGVVAVT